MRKSETHSLWPNAAAGHSAPTPHVADDSVEIVPGQLAAVPPVGQQGRASVATEEARFLLEGQGGGSAQMNHQ